MSADLTILASPYGENIVYSRIGDTFERSLASAVKGPDKINISDFAAVEMLSQDKRKLVGKTIGGVAIGTILLGPLGALAGGLMSGNRNVFLLKVTLVNGVEMLCTAKPDAYHAIQSASFSHAAASIPNAPSPAQVAVKTVASSGTQYEYRDNIDPNKNAQMSPVITNLWRLMGWVITYGLGIFACAFCRISLIAALVCFALAGFMLYKLSANKKPFRVATIAWGVFIVFCFVVMSAAPTSQEAPQTAPATQEAPATTPAPAPAPNQQ